jgi:hypothetical protein
MLPLVAFSRFRSPFSIIERLSLHLANTIMDTGIIPIINPVSVRDLASLPENAPWVRRLTHDGVVAYRVEG